jgi:DNA-directed RNA polymerase subunit A''
MAHYVKVLPYRTFRLHPAVCPPYNSDFDGDEMNLHVPQSEEARSEALTLMRVQDQILSPRYGGPIIGGIRDFLTAAYLLTKEGVYLTKEEFTNLAMAGGFPPDKDLPKPEKTEPHPLYTGRQLFSLFLPSDFNYVLVSKWEKSSRGAGKDVVIKNGTLLSGVIDRAAIGAEESDSILHRIAKDYGTDEARNFLNSILRLLKAFITRSGFSYGFDELELPNEVRSKISETLDESYAKVKDLNSQYKSGTLPETRGLSPEDALEFYVANELSRARERAGRIADRSFSPQNAGIIMARTGARGSTLNLGQMTAALGQQSVRGKRIEKGYLSRALPHFFQNDPSPDARGFVRSNYRDGLNPIEFFFHARGGREGLVDTAVRTQQSGYMQRRLVNALEHLKVEYDLTVRDPNGNVIQFKYGEDGIDPAKSDHGRAVNLERLIDTTALSSDPSRAAAESTIERTVEKYSEQLNPRLRKDLLDALKGSKLDPKSVEKVCERVVELVVKGTVEPGEASGIVAAQSIGEPGTQMSIAPDERVIIQEKGRVKAVRIGDFVDGLMLAHQVSKEGDTEWCDLPSDSKVEVPSLDDEGKIHWKPLRSVSRHHHNRPLLRIRTRSGRTITATDNHSFVRRVNGKLVPVLGKNLTTGDRIPVVKHLPISTAESKLDASEVLPRSTHWFGSEVTKAQNLVPKWYSGYGSTYQVPVKRDQLRNVLTGRSSVVLQDRFVYPLQVHGNAGLPEVMQLDGAMGWLIGAYLSEGCAQKNYVSISNTEEGFLTRARDISGRMGMKFHEVDNTSGFASSHEIVVHSSILSEFLSKACGKLSKEKHIPDFAVGASDDFVASLLRGYFDGDGHIDVKRFAIRAGSRSKELIDGVVLLLARFGILASKVPDGKSFSLWIPARFATIFRDKIGTDIHYKKLALDELSTPSAKRFTYEALDMTSGFGGILHYLAQKLGIPTRRVNNFTKRQHIGRATLARYIEIFEKRASELGKDISEELASLRKLLEEDVTWDEITSIENVRSGDDRVYDFSVPGLETFVTAECVVTHNTLRTFHFAGVKERDVTLGLPRLIELVDARKQPATPSMDVFLDEDTRKSNEKAIRVANMIRFTKVVSVVDKAEVDPSGEIYLFIGKAKLAERQCTLKDIVSAIESPKREVTVDEQNNIITIKIDVDYASLHIHKNKILNQKVKGIPGIDRVTVVKEGDEWKIQTSGSNLQKVRQIEGVDKSRTTTNNIFEIYQALGIEAARSALVREIIGTLEEQGLEVDIRHIYLVADLMTSKGFLQQIGRHGVAGTKTSVLARAAFEITVPTLAEAAVRGETEELRGVTENVIVGLPIPVGTGMIDVFMRGV